MENHLLLSLLRRLTKTAECDKVMPRYKKIFEMKQKEVYTHESDNSA
jgi:hypothetical protein